MSVQSRTVMSGQPASPKQEARELLDRLPDDVTWDDLLYEFAVRRSIELGLADSDAGRVRDGAALRKALGLD